MIVIALWTTSHGSGRQSVDDGVTRGLKRRSGTDRRDTVGSIPTSSQTPDSDEFSGSERSVR